MTEPQSFEQRLANTVGTLTVCVVILGVCLGLALGAAGYGVVQGQSAIGRAQDAAQRAAGATHQATVAARQAKLLAVAVAAERNQTILRECNAQNLRHTSTIAELDVELAQIVRHSTPSQRKQLRASRAFTLLLIDRLAPYRNCAKQLAADTKTK